MPTKIRLQRHGRKSYSFFHIVVADSRAPRDGKNITKLGVYNPNTNPATIELDIDGALRWLENGAQPTDTCRAILSYKGVLYKKHLQGGVKKGAFTQEQADAKFEKWMNEKAAKIQQGANAIVKAKETAKSNVLKAEEAANEAKAQQIAAKNSELSAEVEAAAEVADAETEVAEPTAEATEVAEVEVAEPDAPVAEAEVVAAAEPEAEAETPAEPVAEVEAPAEENSADEENKA